MSKKNEIKDIFTSGILKENPVFILFLGMCPALGVTSNLTNAVGMGFGVFFVLLLSNIIVSLIRHIVPAEIRIPVFIVIIATLVTILQMLMQAFTADLYESMKVFIPLIVVNCLILGRAEAFASKNNVFRSTVDAIGMSLGFMLGLVAIAFFRELLAIGSLFGYQIIPEFFHISAFSGAVGAFLTLGVLSGLINVFVNYKKDKTALIEKERIAELKKVAAAKKLSEVS